MKIHIGLSRFPPSHHRQKHGGWLSGKAAFARGYLLDDTKSFYQVRTMKGMGVVTDLRRFPERYFLRFFEPRNARQAIQKGQGPA